MLEGIFKVFGTQNLELEYYLSKTARLLECFESDDRFIPENFMFQLRKLCASRISHEEIKC